MNFVKNYWLSTNPDHSDYKKNIDQVLKIFGPKNIFIGILTLEKLKNFYFSITLRIKLMI